MTATTTDATIVTPKRDATTVTPAYVGTIRFFFGLDGILKAIDEYGVVRSYDAGIASNVVFTPNGDIASIDVQDAIVEVRDDTDTKLSAKQNTSEKGAISGYCPLDASQYVPLANINPSLSAVTSVNTKTGAVVLSTADISDSSNKRYVTNAGLVVLANTSGTNTGDQTNISGNSATTTSANGLTTATTTVSVSGATAPSSGQVLVATSSTSANWQTPATLTRGRVLGLINNSPFI